MGSDDPLIGRQLASFRIERVLGRGGMATVYYGWDVKLERPVALKVIDARYQDDPAYAVRFVNEAKSIAALRHPNVIQVYYADDAQGLYYFAMEYVTGQDLGALLDEHRRAGKLLPLPEVMRIGRAIANGLDYAHQRGVIHRDVKPSNVMVAEDGRVVLMDFGLAMNVAHGTLGTVFGSPQYFAPEQARNSADVVPQSDLYSLGVILYEMLTGRLPFDDQAPLALARQHMEQEPPPPRQFNPLLSAAVEEVLLKALRKAPQDRFQTGQALMVALGQALDVPEPTMPFLDLVDKPRPARAAGLVLNQAVSGARMVGGVAKQGAGVVGGAAKQRVLIPLAAGLAALWAAVRRRPATGAVIRFLEQHPPARWGAGFAMLLLVVEITWLAGYSFKLGQAGKAGHLVGTPNPINVAVAQTVAAAQTAAPTRQARPSTNTPPARPSATRPPNTPAATLSPEEGDHFVLFYDDTALYFKNATENDRAINPVAFERLDGAGNPLNRWEGSRWGQIYADFRAGYCLVAQIIDYRSHKDPPECKKHQLVVRTPSLSDPGIFWTTQKGSEQFRVLWNNVEVGRCAIAAQHCDVYLPQQN
jgi:predicted Ser/Thr protein kinase